MDKRRFAVVLLCLIISLKCLLFENVDGVILPLDRSYDKDGRQERRIATFSDKNIAKAEIINASDKVFRDYFRIPDVNASITMLRMLQGQENSFCVFDRNNDGFFDLTLTSTYLLEHMIEEGTTSSSFHCDADLSEVLKDAANYSVYANRLLLFSWDASGIAGSGWFYPGNYDACSSLRAVRNTMTMSHFSGKYFSVTFQNKDPSLVNRAIQHLTFGVCLPDSCSENNVRTLINNAMIRKSETCQNKDHGLDVVRVNSELSKVLDHKNIIGLTIVVLIILIGLLATVYDFFLRKRHLDVLSLADTENELTLNNILTCFCFVHNVKTLFKAASSESPLACLNGLRVLSIVWIVLWNTFTLIKNYIGNPEEAYKDVTKRFLFQPIVNGSFPVDTFFFLSGLFIAYGTINDIQRKRKMKWLYFFIFRYGRVTPAYSFLLLFFITLFPLTISGPFAMLSNPIYKNQFYRFQASCDSNWWSNLLYINNLYPNYGRFLDGCMGWSWYLATDMQMHVFISPILIYMFHKKPKVGISLAVILVFLSIGVTVFLTLHYGLKDIFIDTPTRNGDPWNDAGALYTRVYVRCPAYIIGMMTGYFLLSKKNQFNNKINTIAVLVAWATATCVGLALIYGPYYFKSHPDVQMSELEATFYIPLARPLWVACISTLVILCAYGYGGPIDHILSWPMWVPLARTTLCVYLVHPMVIFWYLNNLTKPLHFSVETYIVLATAMVFLSLLVAIMAVMLVESPMLHLLELFIKARTEEKGRARSRQLSNFSDNVDFATATKKPSNLPPIMSCKNGDVFRPECVGQATIDVENRTKPLTPELVHKIYTTDAFVCERL